MKVMIKDSDFSMKKCIAFKSDENKSMLGAFGDLNSVRQLINDLRDCVEDNQEDGFISI